MYQKIIANDRSQREREHKELILKVERLVNICKMTFERRRFDAHLTTWNELLELLDAAPSVHEQHENRIGDTSEAEKRIRNSIPEKMRHFFNVPQRGIFHKEGPTLLHHIQAMLNALHAITSGTDQYTDVLPEHYRKLIIEHELFFSFYCLLHDLGKAFSIEVLPDGSLTYPRHEQESRSLIQNHQLIPPQSLFQKYMKNVILHHVSFLDKDGISDEYQTLIREGTWFDPELIELMLCCSFLDLAWRDDPTFGTKMKSFRNAVDLWTKIAPTLGTTDIVI